MPCRTPSRIAFARTNPCSTCGGYTCLGGLLRGDPRRSRGDARPAAAPPVGLPPGRTVPGPGREPFVRDRPTPGGPCRCAPRKTAPLPCAADPAAAAAGTGPLAPDPDDGNG